MKKIKAINAVDGSTLHPKTILSIFPRVAHLLGDLFLIWITLDWKVRKARKAFEKELIRQGVSRKDARRLSKPIKNMKDQITHSIFSISTRSARVRGYPFSEF